jgi:hypothetical protein
VALGLAANIAVSAQALAGMCMPGTLADYLPGGAMNGCTIGNYKVDVTSYGPGDTGIDASRIRVTPITGAPGLQFTFPTGELTTAGANRSVSIEWTISDTASNASIRNAAQSMNASVTGAGRAEITNSQVALVTTLQAGIDHLSDGTKFPSPVNSVRFDSSIRVAMGINAGTATISSYKQQIDTDREIRATFDREGGAT